MNQIMRTSPLSTGFGLEIHGVDLCEPPTPRITAYLAQALAEHHLLVLRALRRYSAADQVAWTRPFGEVERYPSDLPAQLQELPEVLRLTNVPGRGYLNSAEFWHQDGSFREFPTYLSFFNMAVRPDTGGATMFVDIHDAYVRLPEHLRKVVDTASAWQRNGCRHAQVRWHPVTARQGLFINLGYTALVEGLTTEQTGEFLDEIGEFLDAAETYVHGWEEGDLLIADNAALVHRASPDPVRGERTLLRTCVEGTVTF